MSAARERHRAELQHFSDINPTGWAGKILQLGTGDDVDVALDLFAVWEAINLLAEVQEHRWVSAPEVIHALHAAHNACLDVNQKMRAAVGDTQ
jgi:hypothetical protein